MELAKSSQSQWLEQHLWWRHFQSESDEVFELSGSLEQLLGIEATDFATFKSGFLPESQAMLVEQLANIGRTPGATARFLMGVSQKTKPIWLINDLKVMEQAQGVWIIGDCCNVSDMQDLVAQTESASIDLSVGASAIQMPSASNENPLLQQQFHDQTQFLAMLSHELRSPLMGMNSLLTVVKQKLPPAQQQSVAQELKVMKMTIDQLNFLINDILTYSQTEFNQIQLNPTVFDLHEMADYICQLTKSIATEKGIDVHFSVTTQNECFYGDLVRLSQVLVNLIVNAIKFTQRGGVEVVIKEDDEFIEFHVIDSGEGIDEAELGSIFAPFKQLDSKGGEQYVGSGLGLSIVKTLVELMGGILEVKSKKGQGTDFSFVIPMRSGGCPEDTVWSKSAVTPTPNQAIQCDFKVLVADDSVINRKVMQAFLEEMGCHVDEAEDGLQAWQKFQHQAYDYVFLDIQMPRMNGLEVCQKMREVQSHQATALKGIFALTAAHTEAELVAGLGAPIDKSIFDAWLEKPASQDKVIHLLHCQSIVPPSVAKKPSPKSVESASDALEWTIPAELSHLLPQFKESTDQDLIAFKQAMADQNAEEAKAILHRLKGNLMLFEFTHAVDIVRALETANRNESFNEIRKNLARLEKKLNSLYKLYL